MNRDDDLKMDLEGNIIDEKAIFMNAINKAYLDGQTLILNNMKKFIESDIQFITPVNRKLSPDNEKIFEGIKIAYFKLTSLLDQSLDSIKVEQLKNDPSIKKGAS